MDLVKLWAGPISKEFPLKANIFNDKTGLSEEPKEGNYIPVNGGIKYKGKYQKIIFMVKKNAAL